MLVEDTVGAVTGVAGWLLFVAGEFALPVAPNGLTYEAGNQPICRFCPFAYSSIFIFNNFPWFGLI